MKQSANITKSNRKNAIEFKFSLPRNKAKVVKEAWKTASMNISVGVRREDKIGEAFFLMAHAFKRCIAESGYGYKYIKSYRELSALLKENL